MKLLRLLIIIIVVLAGFGQAALAGSSDPLFVNLTTDDNHKANMAIAFSMEQLKRGHPVTIYVNSQAIQIVNKANNKRYAMQQQKLTEFTSKGGTVYACQVCEKFLKFTESDLIPGVKLSTANSVTEALFKDNTKTLSW
ncbi:MAG: DsrE family protein [Desulfobaccales bacterium]